MPQKCINVIDCEGNSGDNKVVENSTNRRTRTMLSHLAKALGCNPHDFYCQDLNTEWVEFEEFMGLWEQLRSAEDRQIFLQALRERVAAQVN